MAEHATKEDLDHLSKEIKDHNQLIINPIKEDIGEIKIKLNGASGLNGLIGDMKKFDKRQAILELQLKIVYGLLVFVSTSIIGVGIYQLNMYLKS